MQHRGRAELPAEFIRRLRTHLRQGPRDHTPRLVGHLRDQIEVVVVVQHDKPGRFGCRGDQQVGDLCPALLAAGRERVLHLDRSVRTR